VGCGQEDFIASRSGRCQTEAEAQRRWQGRNRRRFEETVGGETGGSEEGGTRRDKEGGCEEGCSEEGGEGSRGGGGSVDRWTPNLIRPESGIAGGK